MNEMRAGQFLSPGGTLDAPNGKARVVLQTDSNLVLYRNDTGEPLWATDTVDRAATSFVMQDDGNAVLYAGPTPLWASDTAGHPGAWLAVQDDANVVVYAPDGSPLWASDTARDWNEWAVRTGDTHLGTARWMNSTARLGPNGSITGRTRIWCTWALRGYTGSVVPMLLDEDDRVLWPDDVQAAKHQYGVDGTAVPFLPDDKTVDWTNDVPPALMASGAVHRMVLVQFLDPKVRFPDIIKAIGEIVGDVAETIRILLEQIPDEGPNSADLAGVEVM